MQQSREWRSAETQTVSAPAGLETLGPVGRLMAERTAQSWASVPHFFVVREVDAGAFREARERLGSAISPGRGLQLPSQRLRIVPLAAALFKTEP
jgi:pyruvate dehydrogenase E2 component (dihydrolipoyllysine-residue acetyltransferase)